LLSAKFRAVLAGERHVELFVCYSFVEQCGIELLLSIE